MILPILNVVCFAVALISIWTLSCMYSDEKTRRKYLEERMQNMQKRIDYMDDKQLNYLSKALADQFEFPDRLKLQKEFFNITNLMINELAILYSEEPLRELSEGASEKESEYYSEIVTNTELNTLMQQVNKLTKLTKNVLVRPVWSNDRIEYRVYTPNMFDIIQDEQNPGKAKAVIYSYTYEDADAQFYNNDDPYTNKDQFKAPDTIFHCWTDEKYYMFTFQLSKSVMRTGTSRISYP